MAEWSVSVGADQTRAVYEPADGEQRAVFVCAHGAGGNMNDRGMLATAKRLREAGLGVVRFNFLYKERGSGRPDAMPKLRECLAAVVDQARSRLAPPMLLIGGRSMGGRAASMMAADDYPCDGLLLLAYPLHPAGLPTKMRDEHLPRIRVPVLCVNGTRDALCRRDLMTATLRKIHGPWTMHWVEGADHSFHVLRSSGRTDADVLDEIAAAARDWASALPRVHARRD